LGTWTFRAFGYYALAIPAALTGATGIGYVIYKHHALRLLRLPGNLPDDSGAPEREHRREGEWTPPGCTPTCSSSNPSCAPHCERATPSLTCAPTPSPA